MLKYQTNEVPEGLEQYYEDNGDGSFVLKVEGVVSAAEFNEQKNKVKEFREKNTELLKKQSTLDAMEGIFGEGGLKPADIESKINKIAQERAQALADNAVKAAQERVKELETGLNTKTQKLSQLMLGEAVQKAGQKHGVIPTAYDDVLRRAQYDFEVTDDGLKFKQEKLDAEGKPYTVESWMAEQAQAAPHLFAQSQGTGAARPAKSGVVNNNSQRSASELIESGLAQHFNTAGNARRLN
jgi:hypothetical protein